MSLITVFATVAAGFAAMSGILYFFMASSTTTNPVLNHSQAPSVTQNGTYFIIAGGIIQLFLIAPLAGQWGRSWYSAATGSSLAFVILWFLLRNPNSITGIGLGSNQIGMIIGVLQVFLFALSAASMAGKTKVV